MTDDTITVRIRELLDKKTGQLVGYAIGCSDLRVTFVCETFTLEVDKNGYRTYERATT